jgi:sulfopyruvate decarboxylase TPP-binding subunit
MEEYFSVFKAKNRARIHGTSCDILSLIDRFSMEKIHHKFCISVLGIKKTSSNIAAKSELGRLPLDMFIKTQAILYFSRINCKEINPLVQEAFKLNKKMAYTHGILLPGKYWQSLI